MALDPIKIAQMLRSLPDAQLAPLAQGMSPNVNPQEAQMEMARRAQTRKSAQMGSSGIQGLKAGGMVRRFNAGGPAQLGRLSDKYLEEEEKKLAEAKRKRGEQMKANSGAFRERAGQVVSDVGDMAKKGLGLLIPDAVERNFARQQALRDPAAVEVNAKNKAYEDLMMQAEQMPEPVAPTPILQQNAGAVTPPTNIQPPPPTNIQPPPPAASKPAAGPSARPTSAGITTLASPQATAAPAASPAIGQTPPDDLDAMEAKLAERVQKQMEPFKAIYAARAEALQAGKRDPLDMDKAKKQRFYEGLLKFGTSLLASNAGTRAQRLGMAFDQGVQAFAQGVKEDKGTQESIRQESLKIALQVQDTMLAEMGMGVEMRKAFGKELMDSIKERREQRKDTNDQANKQVENKQRDRQLDIQEQGNKQQYAVGMARVNADGGSGSGFKEKDRAALRADAYQKAMKALDDNPKTMRLPQEEKIRQATISANSAVQFALNASGSGSGTPTLEDMLKAELARRSKQ